MGNCFRLHVSARDGKSVLSRASGSSTKGRADDGDLTTVTSQAAHDDEVISMTQLSAGESRFCGTLSSPLRRSETLLSPSGSLERLAAEQGLALVLPLKGRNWRLVCRPSFVPGSTEWTLAVYLALPDGTRISGVAETPVAVQTLGALCVVEEAKFDLLLTGDGAERVHVQGSFAWRMPEPVIA
jgi:hypothetical protein